MSAVSLRSSLACGAACAALLSASAASAQTAVPQSDWRQADRASRRDELRYASPQSFALELRFGPYYANVDDEFGGTGPYTQTFGDDPRFYFGLEFDWLPLRIPYVGVVGPGVGWGYTKASAKAKITGTDELSDQDTSLMIMPMHLSAVVRFDEMMRRTGVPFVPYVKAGLGFGIWSAGSASETAKVGDVSGEDTTWGTHLAVGGMLALNWLDRRSAAQLDESTGVNHAYLFAEWMRAGLSGLGSRPQMNIGTSTWVAGLAFDM